MRRNYNFLLMKKNFFFYIFYSYVDKLSEKVPFFLK